MITLQLEIAEVNTVIAGLGKLPLDQAIATWQKIVQQAQSQAQAQAPQEPAAE